MRELLDFLADISDNHEGFFIEAEGRPESINRCLIKHLYTLYHVHDNLSKLQLYKILCF